MNANPYPMLVDQTYMSLTTYRKTGVAVPTPVWFAQEGDKLYIITEATSGKAKRLRHTSRVEIAPCTVRGEVTGESMQATARLVPMSDALASHANGLLNKKYGLLKRLFDLMYFFRRTENIIIEVSPASDE